VWNQRHLMTVLREYEDFYNTHRHRALNQAAPLRPLPDGVADLDQVRVQRQVWRRVTWRWGTVTGYRRGLSAHQIPCCRPPPA
jgi:hypothetical protein